MRAEPPESGAKLCASLDFHCLKCGRHVENYEGAWFSGRKICSECYYGKEERRYTRCFRKLESSSRGGFFQMDASTARSAS